MLGRRQVMAERLTKARQASDPDTMKLTEKVGSASINDLRRAGGDGGGASWQGTLPRAPETGPSSRYRQGPYISRMKFNSTDLPSTRNIWRVADW